MKRILCLMLSVLMICMLLSCKKEETEEPLKPEDVKSVEDIYSLDENKMNFSTLYVVKNEGGIVTFVYEMNENADGQDPLWTRVYVTVGDVATEMSGNYSIITYDGAISPTQLQLGDEIICHHNYTQQTMVFPSRMYAYNLFYTGETKIIDEYITADPENSGMIVTEKVN